MENLTAIEAKVLNAVYELNEADIHAIHEIVSPETNWKYTTIQTIANTLVRKGFLDRKRKGRRFVYTTAVSRPTLFRTILNRFFGVSLQRDPTPLINYLFEIRKLSPKDQETLKKLFEPEEVPEKSA